MAQTADVAARMDEERTRLVAVLRALGAEQWRTPSLCAGWTVREVVVHLLMPYEMSLPRFVGMLLRARFNFDRGADRWARADGRSSAELITALEATNGTRFNVPGAGPEGELSHLVIHAQDVYRPLGVPSPTDPDSARVALEQLTVRGRSTLAPGLLDGVSLAATDTAWSHGDGLEVSGPAVALLTTLAGRDAAVHELAGPGADRLRERVAATTNG